MPGFSVHVFGDTPETKGQSKCGARAIEVIESTSDNLYKVFTKALEDQGYVNGLSLQIIPYDFRICALYNDSPSQVKLSLKMMNKLFSKKSVVMGHSYGNNMILHLLKNMNAQEKEDLIKEYVTLGAPILGALKPMFYMTGSASFLYFSQVVDWTKWKWLGHHFDGINSEYSAQMLPSLDLMFDMIQYPETVFANFNAFQENYEILQENGHVSDSLLSSVYSDTQHAVTGNLIERQFGEMPDYDGIFRFLWKITKSVESGET